MAVPKFIECVLTSVAMTVNLPEASRIRVDVWYIKPTVYALYIYNNLSNDTRPRAQFSTADFFLQEENLMMKVTLLIAVCTLILLLQQMQTPMADPYCESILLFYSMRTDQQTLM